jgi:hypothetical protein
MSIANVNNFEGTIGVSGVRVFSGTLSGMFHIKPFLIFIVFSFYNIFLNHRFILGYPFQERSSRGGVLKDPSE